MYIQIPYLFNHITTMYRAHFSWIYSCRYYY